MHGMGVCVNREKISLPAIFGIPCPAINGILTRSGELWRDFAPRTFASLAVGKLITLGGKYAHPRDSGRYKCFKIFDQGRHRAVRIW